VLLTSSPLGKLAIGIIGRPRWHGYDSRAVPQGSCHARKAPGFYFSFWHAIWAPKGSPKDVVAKLNGALMTTLADPAIRRKLLDLSQDIFPRAQQTPEALRAFHQAEIATWWPIIKAAGIKAE